MKKIIYASFIVLMALILVGCGSRSSEGDNNQNQNGGENNQVQEYNITYEVEGIFFETFGEKYIKTKLGPVNFNELLRNLCKHRLLCIDKLKEGEKLEIDLSEICSNVYINNELTDTNGKISYVMQNFDINIKVELDKSKLGYVIKSEANDTINYYQAYSSSGSIILDLQYLPTKADKEDPTKPDIEDCVSFMDDIMEYKNIVYDTQGRLDSYSWIYYRAEEYGQYYSYEYMSEAKQKVNYETAYFLDYDENGNLLKIYDPGTEQEYEEFDYDQQKYVTKTRISGGHLYYSYEYDGNVRIECFKDNAEKYYSVDEDRYLYSGGYHWRYSYDENGLIASMIQYYNNEPDHSDYDREEIVYIFEYYNFGKYDEFDRFTVGMNK